MKISEWIAADPRRRVGRIERHGVNSYTCWLGVCVDESPSGRVFVSVAKWFTAETAFGFALARLIRSVEDKVRNPSAGGDPRREYLRACQWLEIEESLKKGREK